MVTGNEVSARSAASRLLEVSQRAEIRSLSPHLPSRTFLPRDCAIHMQLEKANQHLT